MLRYAWVEFNLYLEPVCSINAEAQSTTTNGDNSVVYWDFHINSHGLIDLVYRHPD